MDGETFAILLGTFPFKGLWAPVFSEDSQMQHTTETLLRVPSKIFISKTLQTTNPSTRSWYSNYVPYTLISNNLCSFSIVRLQKKIALFLFNHFSKSNNWLWTFGTKKKIFSLQTFSPQPHLQHLYQPTITQQSHLPSTQATTELSSRELHHLEQNKF